MLIFDWEQFRSLCSSERLLLGVFADLLQRWVQDFKFLVGLNVAKVQAHGSQLFWCVDSIFDSYWLINENCSVNLSFTVITESMLGNLINVHLWWEVSISNRLSMKLFMLTQLFHFWVSHFILVCLICTWISSIVVHRDLSRLIIIIISVDFLIRFFVVKSLALLACFCWLSPWLLDSNLWAFDASTKNGPDCWSEVSRIGARLAILPHVLSIDFVNVLYDVQILHHVLDSSLVFGFALRSLHHKLLTLGFIRCIVQILFLGIFKGITVATLGLVKHVVVLQVHSWFDVLRRAITANQVLMRSRIIVQSIWGHGILVWKFLHSNETIIEIVDGVSRLSDIVLLIESSANQLFLTFGTLKIFGSIRLENGDLVVGLLQGTDFCSVVKLIGLFLAQGARTGRKCSICLV